MSTTATLPAVSWETVTGEAPVIGQITLGGQPLELWIVEDGNPLTGDLAQFAIDADGNPIHLFDRHGASVDNLHTLIEGLIEQGVTHITKCSEGR